VLDETIPKIVCTPLRVYVAGPLSAPTKEGIQANAAKADAVARDIFLKGHYPYVPHGQSNWFDDPRIDATDYKAIVEGLDFAWLRVCDAILMLDGWHYSKGARMERQAAVEWGIWIFRSVEELPAVKGTPERLELLAERDHFSRRCRMRLVLGNEKYGDDWQWTNKLTEGVNECFDLENYPFLAAHKLRWMEREHPGHKCECFAPSKGEVPCHT